MSNCQNSTIAIIDSGIGGVSILRELIKKYKVGNYIYFADNQYMPYGNKTKKWLKNRLEYIINFLQLKYKVSHIIIACNTASTCIDTKKYNNVITMKFNNDYTYFATNLTRKNLPEINVIADNTLARKIEQHVFDKKALDAILKRHIQSHKLNEQNTFVLGCTHYELVKPIFDYYCPNSKIINNSSFVLDLINFNNLTDELNIVVMLSKKDKTLEDKINKLIGG